MYKNPRTSNSSSLYWSLLLVLLLGSSCLKNKELTIPQDQLVLVMTDVFMAEASMQRMTSKVKDTLSERYYKEIFEIHQINQEEYLSNLRILEGNPDLAKEVFDAVLGKVGEEENKKEEGKKPEKPEDLEK